MEYVAIASAVLGAAGSIQQAAAQQSMYELQGAQANLEATRRALQYEQRANATLERLNAANATVRAQAFAGGVSGFEGSAALVQTVSGRQAGKDFMTDIQSAKEALRGGRLQAQLYEQAGDTAMIGGYFDALGKLGTGAYQYKTLGGAPTTPAPIEDRSMMRT
jgi:hypothetical protein